MASKGIALLQKDTGREVLKRLCRKAKISVSTIEQLVDAELEQVGKRRKRGLWEQFDEILDEVEDESE